MSNKIHIPPELLDPSASAFSELSTRRSAIREFARSLVINKEHQRWIDKLHVLKWAYTFLNIPPAADRSGDKLIDAISNLQNRSMYASTTIGLSEKNKTLSAKNAQLQADIAKLRDKNTFLANENDRLNELCSHPLQGVFDDCIDELVNGKGQERHGQGKPFMEQPWKRSGDVYGTGFHYGQADKKLEEAQFLANPEARIKECIGAINSIAMGILYERIKANPAEG